MHGCPWPTRPPWRSTWPPALSSLRLWQRRAIMLLPLLLMIAKTVVELTIDKQHPPVYMPYVNFVGTPMIALFISAVVAYIVFGLKRGFNWDQLGRFSEQGMAPLASASFSAASHK